MEPLSGQSAPLYEVPVEHMESTESPAAGESPQKGLAAGEPVAFSRARLLVLDADAAEAALALTWENLAVEEGGITVQLGKTRKAVDPPQPSHSEASFVIDFDTEPVQQLLKALVDLHGPKPTLEQITDFVDQTIQDKNLSRGWDLASKVADLQEGDCTEHAVLLTALARATGWPSRVVLGVVLMRGQEDLQAFGHAWSEGFDGKAWQRLDAALGNEEEEKEAGNLRYYLPLNRLHEEGPGYTFALAVSNQRTSPSKVQLLGTAP